MRSRTPDSPDSNSTSRDNAAGPPEKSVGVGRRRFLLGLGAGGVSAAAAAVTTAPATASPQEQTPSASKSRGYHETDHVQRYYRTARF
jgi:hypothetical protein